MKTGQTAIQAVDTPHFNYWQALYLSFYSRPFYVDVGKRWKSLGLQYFFFLMLILMIPFSIRLAFDFNTYSKNYIKPLERTPVFYIQNGKVQFDKPMPYFIKNSLNQVVVIVDTTGKVAAMSAEYPYLSLLVTGNRIYSRTIPIQSVFMVNKAVQQPEISLIEIPQDTNEAIDTAQWTKGSGFKLLNIFVYLSIYPIMIGVFFGMYGTIIFVFSFIGQTIAVTILKYNINYFQAFRLISVSTTPHLILLIMGLTFDLFEIWVNAIAFLSIFVYFSFGVLGLRKAGKQLVHN